MCIRDRGMTLICVTLNDPNDWNDHISLHNEMFEKYKNTELISTNKIIDKVVAGFGLLGYCGVSPDKTYICLLYTSNPMVTRGDNAELDLSGVED